MEKQLNKNRILALENYYKNPNKCKNCEKVINVLPHQKINEVKIK